MSRILDSEFRKALYKNLVDAGYDKTEAKKIVGVKYYDSLKEKVLASLASIVEKINADTFEGIEKETPELALNIEEMKKLKELI